MTTRPPVPERARRRYTSLTLTGGVLVAATLFAIAIALEISGAEPGGGDMTDLTAVADGLVALAPWAWAAAGVYAVIGTPVIGLAVTIWEYALVGDRRTVALAIAVIAVLATSAVVAIWR